MKIRVTGLPAEVEAAAARIAGVLTVLEISRPYPRRGNSALVSRYLDVTPDAPDAPAASATPGAAAEGAVRPLDTDPPADRAAAPAAGTNPR